MVESLFTDILNLVPVGLRGQCVSLHVLILHDDNPLYVLIMGKIEKTSIIKYESLKLCV